MLFCWLAASVAIQSILLPVDLGPFWILHYVIESYQSPKMGKLYSYTFFLYFPEKVEIIELSYFPALLPGALSNLTGKQQVSTSQGSSKAEAISPVQH